jgi:hypothetical protein
MDAIDLTLSDSDQDVRLVKRQRRSLSDDDVQVIEKPEVPTPAVSGPEPALGDKDLLITRATGPVFLWLLLINGRCAHHRALFHIHLRNLTQLSLHQIEHVQKFLSYSIISFLCDV